MQMAGGQTQDCIYARDDANVDPSRLTKGGRFHMLNARVRYPAAWPVTSSKGGGLIEVLRTNDLVLISKAEAVLADAGIKVFVADRHMSAVEGSLPFLPRRLLVASETAPRARRLLTDAGLGSELREI
jgi:hypothetical protein